ncbi:hypothetical protein DFJ74DRAFT_640543 [Hyaloraphidium curvatum]|nr:hypothetical protein DFJ74DRAFT_640543 [Hyaloraphidium curvatum]
MAATGGAAPAIESTEVGWLFVQEYYTFLNKSPHKLHQFYNQKSYLIHGHEGETVKLCHGTQEIQNRIAELDFNDCKVLVSNVDSQTSLNGGIIVQVLGEMSNKGGPHHKFAQTFFLAQQPHGYYVLNDIFRFLKEEVDNDADAYDDLSADQGPVIQEQFVNDYQQKVESQGHRHVEHAAAPQPEVAPAAAAAAAAVEIATEQAPAPATSKPRGSPDRAPGPAAKPAAPAAEEKPEPAAEQAAPEPATENHVNHVPAEVAAAAGAKAEASAAKSDASKTPKSWAALASATPKVPPTAQSPKKPEPQAPAPAKAEAPAKPQATQTAPRREPPKQTDDAFSIFVRNVREGITIEMLKEVFGVVGTVKSVEIRKQNAFVEFATKEMAQIAIKQHKFQSPTQEGWLYVEEKKRNPGPPAPRTGAPRGGRGGRGGAPANMGDRKPPANGNGKPAPSGPAPEASGAAALAPAEK